MSHHPIAKAGFDAVAFLGLVVGWLSSVPAVIATLASLASLVYYSYQIYYLRKDRKGE